MRNLSSPSREALLAILERRDQHPHARAITGWYKARESLVAKGLLVKVETKRYRLNRAGKRVPLHRYRLTPGGRKEALERRTLIRKRQERLERVAWPW